MSTAYRCNLDNGQQLYLENWGEETLITLSYSSSGQQQSQSTQFSTGVWQAPPTIQKTNQGWVVQVSVAQGDRYIQIQSQGMQLLTQPNFESIEQVSPQPIPSESAFPEMPFMQPMQPMQPMKMGDMEMQLQPMQMRMGNLEMRMGNANNLNQPKFCSQCGNALKPDDRFCSQCGQQITTT